MPEVRMELYCAVSLGEILDRISILRIKLARIKDTTKNQHVRHELERLNALIKDIPDCEQYIADLTVHNTVIWDVEDQLRNKERLKLFDSEFVELARLAYLTNDKRFAVKDTVN